MHPTFYGAWGDLNLILMRECKHFLLTICLPSTPSITCLCEMQMCAEQVQIIQEQSATS